MTIILMSAMKESILLYSKVQSIILMTIFVKPIISKFLKAQNEYAAGKSWAKKNRNSRRRNRVRRTFRNWKMNKINSLIFTWKRYQRSHNQYWVRNSSDRRNQRQMSPSHFKITSAAKIWKELRLKDSSSKNLSFKKIGLQNHRWIQYFKAQAGAHNSKMYQ